ncbi:MAG: type II toxin-antitoxin system RelE/ParE family toxin [Gemmatimonadaceae bacterium]
MLRTFGDKDTARLFARERVRRWSGELQHVALRKLRMLDAATTLDDLRVPPANRLEKLKGDRRGQWSIRVNDQWRICFRWEGTDAHDVELVDYH